MENQNINIVSFPDHLFIPKGAESVDVRILQEIPRNTLDRQRLVTLKAKQGESIFIIAYAMYTDAEFAKDIEFFFKQDKSRILRYHGVPNDELNPTAYNMSLGVSAYLDNAALIPCQIVIGAGQELTIDVVNCDPDLDTPMGVRLFGYVMKNNSTQRPTR